MNDNECDHDCEACWKRAAEDGARKGIEAVRKEVDREVLKAVWLYVEELKRENPVPDLHARGHRMNNLLKGVLVMKRDEYYDNHRVCPKCGSQHVNKRGFAETNVGKFQRYRCDDCGSWSRVWRGITHRERKHLTRALAR